MTLSNIASIALYIFVFLSAYLFAHLRQKTNYRFFGFLAIFIPALIISLRFGVGTDSMAYSDLFSEVSTEPIEFTQKRLVTFSMEPTAILTIKAIHFLNFNLVIFYLFYSLITFSCFYLFARKADEKHFWLIFGSLIMLMLPYSINGMRQTAAIAIFSLLLIRMVKNPREILPNFCLFVLAFLFHFSTAMLSPILLVPLSIRRNGAKKTAFLIATISLLAFFLFPGAISLSLNLGLLPSKYAETLELYGGSVKNYDFVIFSTVSLLLILSRSFPNSVSKETNSFITLIVLCSLFYAGLGFHSAYIGRMADYFWPMTIFSIWLGIDRFKDSRRLKKIVYISCLTLYFVLVYFIMGNSQIIPFRFLV